MVLDIILTILLFIFIIQHDCFPFNPYIMKFIQLTFLKNLVVIYLIQFIFFVILNQLLIILLIHILHINLVNSLK